MEPPPGSTEARHRMAIDFDIGEIADLLGFGSDIHFGIDVGASSVKIVAMKGNKSKSPKIVGVGFSETPAGCVIDGMLSDTRTMAEIVRGTLERMGLRYKKQAMNVGLRGLNVVFKRLLLPFQRPEEMAQQVLLEAQQHVDSDLADWVMDFQILGLPDSQGQVGVMLVAAKRSAVEEYENLVRLVGGRPAVFDCDVFAIENCHELNYGLLQETVMCLDVGKDSSKVNILQEGAPILVRSISMGGQHLTELIQRNMAVDMDQAEQMKIQAAAQGTLSGGDLAHSLGAHIEEMCEEIKRTLEFFSNAQNELKIGSIDRVVLSGGGSSVSTLASGIGKLLGCEVVHAQPFQAVPPPDKFQELVAPAPHAFAAAVGLALRSVGDKPA